MYHKIVWSITMFLASCSGYRAHVYIQPEYSSIVQEFVDTGRSLGVPIALLSLDVRSGDPSEFKNPQELAFCEINPGMTPQVVVRKSYWDAAGISDRRELLFHELGHCVLGKPHRDDHVCIMNTYHLGPKVYNPATYAYFDRDLFLTE